MAQTTVPSLDTTFQVLSDGRRRRLLVTLEDQGSSGESVRVPDDLPTGEQDPERVRIEMYHRHLPTLEAAGYVQWDRDTFEVKRGPSFDEIRPLLDYVREQSGELTER